jgi:hypothetical protein
VADRGWVLNRDERRWELRGPDGAPVGAYVTLEFLTRTQVAAGRFFQLDRYLDRRGLPRLTPHLAWWECVLIGGPFAGRHEYLDPRSCRRPPDQLLLAQEPPIPVPLAGEEIPVMTEAVPPAVYRRAPQACGHGRACPWPYRWSG